jgi:hypothetical protein
VKQAKGIENFARPGVRSTLACREICCVSRASTLVHSVLHRERETCRLRGSPRSHAAIMGTKC